MHVLVVLLLKHQVPWIGGNGLSAIGSVRDNRLSCFPRGLPKSMAPQVRIRRLAETRGLRSLCDRSGRWCPKCGSHRRSLYPKSLDFLGFSRVKRAFSMGYTGFSRKEISRALLPRRAAPQRSGHGFWRAEAHLFTGRV
jgi:hypothetical protein